MMLCSSHCILSCGAWLWFISLFMMFILFSGLRWFCQVSHCKLTPCNNKHSVGRYFQAIWISLIKLKFIYLYISVWIHGFPFYSVHYNLLILFCQWDSLEADFCILLICSYHWEFPCWHRMFQVHLVPFPAITLELAISPKSSGEYYLESNWVCAHCYWSVVPPRPFSRQS